MPCAERTRRPHKYSRVYSTPALCDAMPSSPTRMAFRHIRLYPLLGNETRDTEASPTFAHFRNRRNLSHDALLTSLDVSAPDQKSKFGTVPALSSSDCTVDMQHTRNSYRSARLRSSPRAHSPQRSRLRQHLPVSTGRHHGVS